MKKFFIMFLALVILSVPVYSQDSTKTDGMKKIAFTGFRYDDGPVGSYGTGFNPIGNAWAFTYADFGEDQSANLEFAYIVNIKDAINSVPILNNLPVLKDLFDNGILSKINAGPIVGPDFDFRNGQSDTADAITYVRAAIGFIGTYQPLNNAGLWGYVKRKLSFDDNSGAGRDWVAGGGVYLEF